MKPVSNAQNLLQWTDSIVVASTPALITAPRLEILPDGTPVVSWGVNGSPPRIWLSRFTGGQFAAPVSVVSSPYVPQLFGFGGYDIAVSGNQIYTVFEHYQHSILLARSDDGGLSFNPPVVVQGLISGGATTLASVTTDDWGNPLVSYILEKNGATYQFRRSIDGGLTFQPAVEASSAAPGAMVCECCTSDLSASGDSVWIVFRNNDDDLRETWVARSVDGGAVFDTASKIDETGWVINACPISGPRMAVARDSLLGVWMSKGSGPARVYANTLHSATLQSGNQFEFLTTAGENASQNQPDVVALADTVAVVFQENGKNIVVAFSTAGAAGLSTGISVFSVPGHTLQYPALAYRNGVLHLVYVDQTAGKVLYRKGSLLPPVSVKESGNSFESFRLFPNPAQNVLAFQSDQLPEQIEIYTLLGQMSLSAEIGEQPEIQIGHLPAAVYMVRLIGADGQLLGFKKLFKTEGP